MAAEERKGDDSRVPVILRIKRRRNGDAADALGRLKIFQAIHY